MLLSKKWLAEYVELPASTAELAERLALAGLNHEAATEVDGDAAIEIEVTSNRPDCLGHLGVAREVGVLYGRPLRTPDPRPAEGGAEARRGVVVEIAAADICPYYSARVIRGVRVGPSPAWLVDRLRVVGVATVNNVVDVTNYVMLETGQPLHAFDLARVRGGRIVVRRATPGEPFEAINHKTYALDERMCVIADAERPVALAGVMGGADTEISAATVDVLLESAQFAPLPVRAAARGLVLASASSYRFERGPDPAMVDWASRRAAALILDLAGGTLERGVVEAGALASTPAEITLRSGRVTEVLGIDVPAPRQREILVALGFVETGSKPGATSWRAPTWRRDCWREIDLVEEIARIENYDRVPEDVTIAARPVEWTARETAVRRAGEVLVGAGFCEALTRSVVSDALESCASPWSDSPALTVAPALVRGADRLRRTLVPSLLEALAGNLAGGTADASLFEVARAYVAWPVDRGAGAPTPVQEPLLVSGVATGDYFRAKGVAEAVLARLGVDAAGGDCVWRPLECDLLARGRAAEVVRHRAGSFERVGIVGEVASAVLGRFGLAGPVAALELRLDRLDFAVDVERPLVRPSEFPAVDRDLNLVVAETVPWAEVEAAIRAGGNALLERLQFVQVWHDAARIGAGKKSFVVSLRLRSATGTLSGDDAAAVVDSIVAECGRRVGATLRA